MIVSHNTHDFTWEPKTRRFVAECSDFIREPWTVLKEGEHEVPYCFLYNLATGNFVLFNFLHTLESDGPDYEIEAWVFGATPEECEKNPRLFGVEIHFLND